MKENRRKQLVYLTLPLALAWGVWNFFGTSGARQTNESEAALATIAPLAPDAGTPPAPMIDSSLADNPWGRDPFLADERKSFSGSGRSVADPTRGNSDGWQLSGIVYDKRSPMAVLNGRTVRIGDEIDGAVVRAITKQEVRIEYKGLLKTLRVS